MSDPLCTIKIFKSSGALNVFHHIEDKIYHFNHLGLNGDQRNDEGTKLLVGRFTWRQNLFQYDYGIKITSIDSSSSEYDVVLLLPSCDYYKCLPEKKSPYSWYIAR